MLKGSEATRSGVVERDGAIVRYQVFGSGERAILLLPTWSIVHVDFWRNQASHLAERYTVLTFDGLGNGASGRPTDPAYYSDQGFATDAIHVMDTAGVEQAVPMSVSAGAGWHLALADRAPGRVPASVFIAPSLPLAPLPSARVEAAGRFEELLEDHPGWLMWNRAFWHEDWAAFLNFFFSQCFTEPSSADEIAHFVSMGLETTPELVSATMDGDELSEVEVREAATSLMMPTLVIHGDEDAIASVEVGRELARLSGAELLVLPGSGHEPQCRIPAEVNDVIDGFLARHYPPI